MRGLPDYIVIPRFIPRGGPVKIAGRQSLIPDATVREMRRLKKQGRSAKWIWAHLDLPCSHRHVIDILAGKRRTAVK